MYSWTEPPGMAHLHSHSSPAQPLSPLQPKLYFCTNISSHFWTSEAKSTSIDVVDYGHEENVATQNCAPKALNMSMMRSNRVTLRSFEVAAASKWTSAGNGNLKTKTRVSHQFAFDENSRKFKKFQRLSQNLKKKHLCKPRSYASLKL